MSEKPLIEKAAVVADGPGIGLTFISFFMHSLINIFPGSEIVGVPASAINETILFDFKILIIFSRFFFSLNLWLEIKLELILYLENSFFETLVSSQRI